MTQLFSFLIYNYAFIDKNETCPQQDTRRSGQETDGSFSLLCGPPGPLVPGEVRPVRFHPGLWGPLLCDFVAPTWRAKTTVSGESVPSVQWTSSSADEVSSGHLQATCIQNVSNDFRGAINRRSQFSLLVQQASPDGLVLWISVNLTAARQKTHHSCLTACSAQIESFQTFSLLCLCFWRLFSFFSGFKQGMYYSRLSALRWQLLCLQQRISWAIKSPYYAHLHIRVHIFAPLKFSPSLLCSNRKPCDFMW